MFHRHYVLVTLGLICMLDASLRAGGLPEVERSPGPSGSMPRHAGLAGLEPGTEDFLCCVEGPYSTDRSASTQKSNAAVGAQSTLVLLVNFLDDTSEPATPAEAENLIFNASNPDSLLWSDGSEHRQFRPPGRPHDVVRRTGDRRRDDDDR